MGTAKNRGVEQAATAAKVPKHRSPKYPAFPLEDAVERAKQMYAKANRHAVAVPVACDAWGVSPNSGTGQRVISTMVEFGLVEAIGRGEGKRLRLSDHGHTLAAHHDSQSEQYLRAAREVALTPSAHRRVWEHFGGDIPNDDGAVGWELQQWNFSPSAAKTLIQELRATLAFSGAIKESAGGDETPALSRPDPEAPPVAAAGAPAVATFPTPRAAGSRAEPMSLAATAPEAGLRDQPLALISGDAVLRYPHPMTDEDYEFLMEQLHRLKRKLAPAPKPQSEQEHEPDGQE